MEHPRVVRWLHRVFNPVRQFELRQLEKMRSLGGVKPDEYERRRAEAENPNDMTYGQIYAFLAFVVACASFIIYVLIR